MNITVLICALVIVVIALISEYRVFLHQMKLVKAHEAYNKLQANTNDLAKASLELANDADTMSAILKDNFTTLEINEMYYKKRSELFGKDYKER
jgi:hypothetical protein